MFSSFKVAENHQVSMLQCCWMLHTESLVSQKAASSLKVCFLCRGLLTVVNSTLIVLSFGCSRHSFWCWTCVCLMYLRKIVFKRMCLKSHCETIGYEANKRLKRDCQRVAFPVPSSRCGFGCCV